jgi:hypothetical protein
MANDCFSQEVFTLSKNELHDTVISNMKKRFELLHSSKYEIDDVKKLVLQYIQFLHCVKAASLDFFNFDEFTSDKSILDQTTSPERIFTHDFYHIVQGYLPNKFGDVRNSPIKTFFYYGDIETIEFKDFIKIFHPFVDDFDSYDSLDFSQLDKLVRMKSGRRKFISAYEICNSLTLKEKIFVLKNTGGEKANDYDSTLRLLFEKKLRLYEREVNRNQMFGHNLHEFNLDLAKIILPKLLSGEYEDWSEALTNPECQKIMQKIADLNEEFKIGNRKIKSNEQYLDRFDVENSLSDKDWDRIFAKSNEFNLELEKFVQSLCENREYWLQFYNPPILKKKFRIKLASLEIRRIINLQPRKT